MNEIMNSPLHNCRRVFDVCMNSTNSWTLEPWHINATLRKHKIWCNETGNTLPSHHHSHWSSLLIIAFHWSSLSLLASYWSKLLRLFSDWQISSCQGDKSKARTWSLRIKSLSPSSQSIARRNSRYGVDCITLERMR